jgi:hypothetical protein
MKTFSPNYAEWQVPVTYRTGIMSFTNNGRDSALRCPRRPQRRIEKVMDSINFARSCQAQDAAARRPYLIFRICLSNA